VSAVDEIWDARATLEAFKAREYAVDNGWLIETDDTITYPDDPRRPLTNDEYMVTLHNTIDAQIAILNLRLDYGDLPEGSGSRFAGIALALARAINGVTR